MREETTLVRYKDEEVCNEEVGPDRRGDEGGDRKGF